MDAPSGAAITGIAPQFLVDDLERAIAYYRDRLGFELDFVFQSFYASVTRNGFAIHLKHAPKLAGDRAHRRQHEHLDAHVSVSGIQSLFSELQAPGAHVIKPLEERPWACLDLMFQRTARLTGGNMEPVAPDTGQVAAEGRWTRHALATDGNRVWKRSGHAAPDSTMALGLALSRDDSWLSPGSPQAACASSARALEDTVAMAAVPGPRTRFARCPFTRHRGWRRVRSRQPTDRASALVRWASGQPCRASDP